MANIQMYSRLRSAMASQAGPAHLGMRRLTGREEPFIFLVVRWSWIVLALTSIFQCIFFGTITNIIAISSIILAWAILANVYLKPTMLRNYPLSSFLIIGFTATQFYFPLLFTTLEGKPVVFNLELPYQVFFHSTAALLVLVTGHAIYRALVKRSYSSSSSVLSKIGLFEPPADLQLWLMGFIGLAAMVYVYFISPSVGWEVSGAASDKAIQGLTPFSYAPFFIPFGKLYGNNKVPSKRLVPLLIGYTILLFIVSIGRNSRGAFMLGFTSVGFAYVLGLLLGVFKTQLFTVKNLFIGLLGFGLITGPVADLGTAMVIVRGYRNKVSNSELIDLTLQAFNDKQAIRARRLEDKEEQGAWDERYLDNIFTARFSNLKFNDASLVQASKISDQDLGMRTFTINYMLGALPGPFLTALGIDADKDAVYAVSVGDYLYLEAGGPTEALGGFRTGHFAGTGMAAFGWWYLFILGVSMIPVYLAFDKFVAQVRVPSSSPNQPQLVNLRFSFCGMLALTSIFQFLPAETVVATGVYLIRYWFQAILLYAVVYHLTRIVSNVVQGAGTPRLIRRVRLVGR